MSSIIFFKAFRGYADLLLLGKNRNEEGFRELTEITRAVRRGGDLTHQLLTYSRKVEYKKRRVDLNQEISQIRKNLIGALPQTVKIEVILAEDLWPVHADPTRLEQAVMNLSHNAVDAMPDGGRLILETANVFLDEDFCLRNRGAVPGPHVLLSVFDTGRGMDKETLERVFDPFFTTKGLAEGTGLGLAVVYGVVKDHGGYIICHSAPNEGTVVKVYIPALEVEDEAESRVAPQIERGRSGRILLVDGEELIRRLGVDMLTGFDYKVAAFSNGELALNHYRKNFDQFDLIVLDANLPDMDPIQGLSTF